MPDSRQQTVEELHVRWRGPLFRNASCAAVRLTCGLKIRWYLGVCYSSDTVYIHGLVTDIQVNVYIGYMLSRVSFQSWHLLKIK